MAYIWTKYSLNELFRACGYQEAVTAGYEGNYLMLRLSPLEKACFPYFGKLNQLFDLMRHFDKEIRLVVDYESLVKNKKESSSIIYQFISIQFVDDLVKSILEDSVLKSEKLSRSKKDMIDLLCGDIFSRAKNEAKKYV